MIIGSNFNYSSRKFLDDRQECESLDVLKSNPKGLLYPQGFEVYCIKEKQWYYNANESKDNIPVWKERSINNLNLLINKINIKQFGAKGDGITDDTQAIKNAITYSVENNIPYIIFPEGIFFISDTIVIPNSISIEINGLCEIKSNIIDGSALNFIVDSKDKIENVELITGSGRLQITSTTGRNSQYTSAIKISGTGLCNVKLKNIRTNNFYIGVFLEAKNVWNITFENCVLFYCTWGFYYGVNITSTGGVTNAGERLCFKDCTFTQNLIDCVWHGTTWSQTNYHNCSFDMSNCIFYIPRNSTIGWDTGSLKISCNQCHFEGIGTNIKDLNTYEEPKGIYYIDEAPYATILSIHNSTFAIDGNYPLFYSKQKMNEGSRIILNDIFILPNSSKLITYPFMSYNCNVNYSNIYCRGENATIDKFTNLRMKSKPITPYKMLNKNPFLENLDTSITYGTTKDSIIGDWTLKAPVAVNSIVAQDNTTYSTNGKKLIINFDENYSGEWNSTVELSCSEMINVQGGETIIMQVLTNAIKRNPSDITDSNIDIQRLTTLSIYEYDDDKNKIKENFIPLVFPVDTKEIGLPLGVPLTLQNNTKYISYYLTIKNGFKDYIYPIREIHGIFIYKIS